MLTEKRCPACGVVKPLSDWTVCRRAKDGLQYQCKACRRDIRNQYRRRIGRGVLQRCEKYGLNRSDVITLLHIPACQACGAGFGSDFDMKFDHCHEAGHFRGVLCQACNMACSGASPDAAERLLKCIHYLNRDTERVGE